MKLLFFRSVSLVPIKSNLGKGTTAVREKILASSLLVIQKERERVWKKPS